MQLLPKARAMRRPFLLECYQRDIHMVGKGPRCYHLRSTSIVA